MFISGSLTVCRLALCKVCKLSKQKVKLSSCVAGERVGGGSEGKAQHILFEVSLRGNE